MFFHIAKQMQENYPCHWQLGNFSISTDNGWQQAKAGAMEILYKGYVDSGPIESCLEEIAFQTEPNLTGNFCLLVVSHDKLIIQTDRYRSFPIYIADGSIDNLVPKPYIAWCDSLIIVNDDMTVSETKIDIVGKIETTSSTIDDIDQLLANKIQIFAQQIKEPVKVFLSGGVDTLLVYSYIKKYNLPHVMTWNYHLDFDHFWLNNHADLYRHWGYTQIHHWKEPTILVSGAPGDEFTLRSPVTTNRYLLNHGTSILQLLIEQPQCLHATYFKKHAEVFVKQIIEHRSPVDKQQLIFDLCNTVLNDWQHWHLGNTLTWTPLRDAELFKLFLRLPKDLAISQIMDSAVSCELIERNVPRLTKVISNQKNSDNYMKNIQKLLDNDL